MLSDAEANSPPSARRQATRERLLDAATEVFAELGLQGASVEAICARAGFTRGAFYSNFESKEELFRELLEREFAERARYLEEKALELEPMLRGRGPQLDPPEAAQCIAEFLAPATEATAWFVLETEFLLLAMRDPSIAPGHHELTDRFYAGISGVVERVVAAAGRRFTLPIEHAIPVLGEVYQRALRTSVLAGAHAPGGLDELGDRLAELLFAITEQTASE
ncbi:MAG: TetR/AcrR family transcriptional regulator [Leucobacter sp.]